MNTTTRELEQQSNTTERQKSIQSLTKLIEENDTALLVSCGSDHVIRSRPMVNINDHFEGDLYFVSENDGEACRSLIDNPQCNVSIAEPAEGRFASLTGTASVSENRQKLELLWNDACKKWFDCEQPHADLRLIKIEVTSAEIWVENQSLGSRIGSLLSGAGQDVAHSKIDWSNPPFRQVKSNKDKAATKTSPTLSLLHHHEGTDSN